MRRRRSRRTSGVLEVGLRTSYSGTVHGPLRPLKGPSKPRRVVRPERAGRRARDGSKDSGLSRVTPSTTVSTVYPSAGREDVLVADLGLGTPTRETGSGSRTTVGDHDARFTSCKHNLRDHRGREDLGCRTVRPCPLYQSFLWDREVHDTTSGVGVDSLCLGKSPPGRQVRGSDTRYHSTPDIIRPTLKSDVPTTQGPREYYRVGPLRQEYHGCLTISLSTRSGPLLPVAQSDRGWSTPTV